MLTITFLPSLPQAQQVCAALCVLRNWSKAAPTEPVAGHPFSSIWKNGSAHESCHLTSITTSQRTLISFVIAGRSVARFCEVFKPENLKFTNVDLAHTAPTPHPLRQCRASSRAGATSASASGARVTTGVVTTSVGEDDYRSSCQNVSVVALGMVHFCTL